MPRNLSSFTNTLNCGLSYLMGKTRLSYFPKMVSIEPTNCCNFRCSFCPQSSENHFARIPRGRITLEQVEQILKIMRQEGSWASVISFTQDGEPFVHTEFEDMVALANQYGFLPRFASNGSLLNDERATKLCKAGYFLVSVDFSADEAFFESSRGNEGSWETIRQNLRNLLSKLKDYPQANLLITDITNWKYDDKQPRQEDSEKLKALFNDIDCPQSQVNFNSRVFHNFVGTVSTEKKDKSGYKKCPYPWLSFRIRWNGDCVICCRDTPNNTVLGNVFEENSILKIWNNEKYQQIRKLLKDKKPEAIRACRNCDLPWAGKSEQWKLSYIIKTYLKR